MAGNSPVRDKRYRIPVLSVDLFQEPYETPLWSSTQFILKDFRGGLKSELTFNGAFRFKGHDSFGLFTARAARVDQLRQMMGAEFKWVSEDGQELMKIAATTKVEGQEEGPVIMIVSLTHHTVNWSLSGMLLENFYWDAAPKSVVRGLIRVEKQKEAATFSASVIRVNKEFNTLALKFEPMPSATFSLLEAAIKKQGSVAL
jgi:hypothetical protein